MSSCQLTWLQLTVNAPAIMAAIALDERGMPCYLLKAPFSSKFSEVLMVI